jgi:cytochrome bd-type quinol oxidase subunit 2
MTGVFGLQCHHNRQQNRHVNNDVAFFLMLLMLCACSETFFLHSMKFLSTKTNKNVSLWIVELPHHSYTLSKTFFCAPRSFWIPKSKIMHRIRLWNRHITVTHALRCFFALHSVFWTQKQRKRITSDRGFMTSLLHMLWDVFFCTPYSFLRIVELLSRECKHRCAKIPSLSPAISLVLARTV